MYRTTSPSSMGHPKIQGKRRKNTDPNKPKRPTSAYFYYMAAKREEMAKKGETISRVADFTKEVSGFWKALSESERTPFEKKAAVDKKRYTEQMAIYKGKDANKPKRPLSSYFLWLAVFREENKSKYEHRELLSRAGIEWKQLTAAEKKPYEAKADEGKKAYEVAMREYNMNKAKKPKMVQSQPQYSAGASNGAGDEEDEEEEEDEEDYDDEEDE